MPVRVADKVHERDLMSSRPWDGDLPPRSLLLDLSCIRRDDGIWCRTYKVGRLYHVNSNGERCAKPHTLDVTSGQNHDQRRPSSISPHVWWKMMTKVERIQWWLDFPEAESATKSLPSTDCSPLGISSFLADTNKFSGADLALPPLPRVGYVD